MFIFCGCSGQSEDSSNRQTDTKENSNQTQSYDVESMDKLNQKIRIQIGDEEVIISLYDTDLSRQVIEALPLDCSFTDYGDCEKAADVNGLLSAGDTPLGYEPKVGDVVVYEPWGNFTVFYDEFRYSDALAPIGEVESGLEVLSQIDGGFTARVEVDE